MLARIAGAEAQGAQAHIIACFDDTGLEAARTLATGPVIASGEAGYSRRKLHRREVFRRHHALSRSIPAIEHNLVRYGLASRLRKIRASEVPVLDLENPNSDAAALISAEIEAAEDEDRADAIVLGCAGMTDLAARLALKHELPVIDGVAAGVTFDEALVAARPF